ncbi:MAG: DUF2254 domain-containing protein [Planctomycetaceae bacterium]|nr:DUF2254 domain-containing protein [Planctomycetaceae bacterium]
MRAYLLNLWDSFREGFWFKPTLMVLFAMFLAEGANWLDESLAAEQKEIDWLSTTAEASRSTLTAVASATIALAGVVFSITILSLSIASTQFGSRLIRSVMGHTIADWVIGQYIGTALFCLLVLRTIRDSESATEAFVPHIGTALGVVFGLISMWMLIWFVHHVATSIQAPNLVSSVSDELDATIERLFPTRIGKSSQPEETSRTVEEILSSAEGELISIPAKSEGYIEGIDGESLLSHSQDYKGVLSLVCKPGNFVTVGDTLAECRTYSKADTSTKERRDDLIKSIQQVIIIGASRTPRQDVSYATLQLVEIAVRALSPGINDPFTAMSCIDRLSGALCQLAEREAPEIIRRDQSGTPRLILKNVDGFPEVLNDAFNMIRQNGSRSIAVSIRLLESLIRIAPHVTRDGDRQAIERQGESLKTGFENAGHVQADQAMFDEQYAQLMKLLSQK